MIFQIRIAINFGTFLKSTLDNEKGKISFIFTNFSLFFMSQYENRLYSH